MEMLINGQAANTIAVSDRGLQYGDGLFETLAVKNGRPCLWSAHMQRLQEGCQRLGIKPPGLDLLWSEAQSLCRDVPRAVLKIIITRGSGGRGYRPPQEVSPTRILGLHPWPDYPQEAWTKGVWIRSCQTKLGQQPALAGLKHLNRLEQVLARGEWNSSEIVEGVMCDLNGNAIEATMSNIFLVQGERVVTPSLQSCGVAGIMRRQVLEACQALSIPVIEGTIPLAAAKASDEVLLTNSLIGVWPVRRWDDTKYRVPGTRSTTITNYLDEQLAVECK